MALTEEDTREDQEAWGKNRSEQATNGAEQRALKQGNSSGQTNTRSDRYGNNGNGQRNSTSPSDTRGLKNNERSAGGHHDGAGPGSPNQIGNGYTGSGKSQENTKAANAAELANSENKPASDVNYTGSDGGEDSPAHKFVKKLRASSKFRQRTMAAGAIAGGGLVSTMVVFMLMLPLKIEHVVMNLEARFGTAAANAIEKESEAELNVFVRDTLLPGLRGSCHSTIEPGCTFTPGGTGFFKQMAAGLIQGHAEKAFASGANGQDKIIFAKRNGHYYMNINGNDINIDGVFAGKISIFDAPGTKEVSNKEIRQALKNTLQGVTKSEKVAKWLNIYIMRKRLGLPSCVTDKGCEFADALQNAHVSLTDKVNAAKLWTFQLVIKRSAGSWSLMVQCMLAPDQCSTKISPGTEGIQESDLNRKLDDMATEYIAEHGAEKFADLISKSQDLAKLGPGGYVQKLVAQQIASAIADKLGGEGAGEIASKATGEAIGKAIPIAGAVSLLISIVQAEDTLPSMDKYLAYATRAQAAEATYNMYASLADGMKTGHVDLTELGSFSDELGGATKDANGNSSDFTDTPLYASLFGNGTVGDASKTAYRCDDGDPVPTGSTVCGEENFSDPGIWLDGINFVVDGGETATSGGLHLPSYIPGAKEYNALTAPILNKFFQLNHAYSFLTGLVGDAWVSLCNTDPLCKGALNEVSNLFSSFFTYFLKEAIPNPVANMTGGRTFDMMAAGDDALDNESCQVTLGCAAMPDSVATSMQNQELAAEKQAFDSQPLFARVFSTASSYSLVSRLAMDMPGSIFSATNAGVASVLTDPFSRLTSTFSSLFSSNHAFAASASTADPFGITQYGISTEAADLGNNQAEHAAIVEMQNDPQEYWDANCVNGPVATYDETTLTVTTLDSWQAANQSQDANMQTQSNAVNGCIYIQNTYKSLVAYSDPTVVTDGSITTTASAGPDTTASDFTNFLASIQDPAAQPASNSGAAKNIATKRGSKPAAPTGFLSTVTAPAVGYFSYLQAHSYLTVSRLATHATT